MKKKILCLLCVFAMVFAITGCTSSDSAYVGKWDAQSMTLDGLDLKDQGGAFDLELQANGNAIITLNGEVIEGSQWEESDSAITLKDSEAAIEFKKEGENLKADIEGTIVVLKRADQ